MRYIIQSLMAFVICAPAISMAEDVGRETGYPIPRYVSLQAQKANIRRGPGYQYRIDWVFQRRGMPLRVVAEYGNWRKVEDIEGEGGWVHSVFLSGISTAITTAPLLLRDRATERGRTLAEVEQGVLGNLGDCVPDWCMLHIDDLQGWASQSALWGVPEK